MILKLVDDIQSKDREIQLIGQRYFGLAVVSEITELTPRNIRLISLSTQLGGDPSGKKSPKAREVVLSGIIKGDRMILESALAGYLLELKSSPLFDKPTINRKSFEQNEGVEVLKFTARLKLI